MKLLCGLLLLCGLVPGIRSADTPPVYELRIYTTHPGRMPDLLQRFREHTLALFERHGMVNIGYWLPAEEAQPGQLYYVLQHASRAAAKASWQAFGDDPEWQEVARASEANGRIVAKVDSIFLAPADYTPAPFPPLTGRHVFELRTYTTHPGKLDALDARFREHTLALFAKHGMTNVLYTHPIDAGQGAGHTLIYLLAHASISAAKKSFAEFRADPAWIQARDASEANGPLLVNPPKSLFLTPTDFSGLK